MNQKTSRKYELISKIANGEDCAANLKELCEIDFQTAFEMWEYALSRGQNIVLEGFDIFHSASEMKTRTLFCESLPLQKLVYSSVSVLDPKLVNFLVNLILINKLDTADECLTRLRTNTNIDSNEFIRTIVDTTFATYCQRNSVRVPSFNKKQKTLLTEHITKIKGPNKALLLQRIKELH